MTAVDSNGAGRAKASALGPAGKGRLSHDDLRGLDPTSPVDLRRLVCGGFCTFYRLDKDEEECCGCYRVLQGLFLRPPGDEAAEELSGPALGAPVKDALSVIEAAYLSQEPIDYGSDEVLDELVCFSCPFLPDGGCDHRNPALAPDERLEPCGGYAVLAALARAGLFPPAAVVADVGAGSAADSLADLGAGSSRELAERFAEMMEANGGWVTFTTAGDVAKELALLLKGEGEVLVDPRLPGLARELRGLGVEATEALSQAPLGEVLPHAGAAVTGALAAVAATGSVIVGPGEGNEGLLAVVPPHHVVVLSAESIVPEIADALARVAPLAATPGSRVVFVSGPSRTSDIELTTVLGVHGPLRLDVLVVAERGEV